MELSIFIEILTQRMDLTEVPFGVLPVAFFWMTWRMDKKDGQAMRTQLRLDEIIERLREHEENRNASQSPIDWRHLQ